MSTESIRHAELLDVDEMSKRLKVPKSWLYARTREVGPGTIPRIRIGKYIRFELDSVMTWLRQTNGIIS